MNKLYFGIFLFLIVIAFGSFINSSDVFAKASRDSNIKPIIAKEPAATVTALGINANSCTADNLCEANSISVTGDLTAIGTNSLISLGFDGNNSRPGIIIQSNPISRAQISLNGDVGISNNINVTNQVSAKRIQTDSIIINASGSSVFNSYTTFTNQVLMNGSLYSTGPARFQALAGEGNAFVCVNSYGTLFRSKTPCA